MPYTVALPDGRTAEFPDSISKDRAQEIIGEQLGIGPRSGGLAALQAGWENLKGGTAAALGKAGLMDVNEADKYVKERAAEAQSIYRPTTRGWTEAPGTKIAELLGGSTPYMAVPAMLAAGAYALPAAAAAAPLTGAGAGLLSALGINTVGGATAAGLAGAGSLATQYGGYLTQQMDTGKQLKDTDAGKAFAAAVPAAALDVVGMRMVPGLRQIFNHAGKQLGDEQLKEFAKAGLKETLKDYAVSTGKAAGAEGITEAAQAFLGRAQAGLSLTDAKARDEYWDNLVGGAVMGGVLAPVGRFAERRSEAKDAQAQNAALREQQDAVMQQERLNKEQTEAAHKQSPEYATQVEKDYLAAEEGVKALAQQKKQIVAGSPTATADALHNKEVDKQIAAMRKQLAPVAAEYNRVRGVLQSIPTVGNEPTLEYAAQVEKDYLAAEEGVKALMAQVKPISKDSATAAADALHNKSIYAQLKAAKEQLKPLAQEYLALTPLREKAAQTPEVRGMNEYITQQLEALPKDQTGDNAAVLKALMQSPEKAELIAKNRPTLPGLTKQQNELIPDALRLKLEALYRDQGRDPTALLKKQTLTAPDNTVSERYLSALDDLDEKTNKAAYHLKHIDFEKTLEGPKPAIAVPDGVLASDTHKTTSNALHTAQDPNATEEQKQAAMLHVQEQLQANNKFAEAGVAAKDEKSNAWGAWSDALSAIGTGAYLGGTKGKQAKATRAVLVQRAEQAKTKYVDATLREAALHKQAVGAQPFTQADADTTSKALGTAMSDALAKVRSGADPTATLAELNSAVHAQGKAASAPTAKVSVDKPLIKTQFSQTEAQKVSAARGENAASLEEQLNTRAAYVRGQLDAALSRTLPSPVKKALSGARDALETGKPYGLLLDAAEDVASAANAGRDITMGDVRNVHDALAASRVPDSAQLALPLKKPITKGVAPSIEEDRVFSRTRPSRFRAAAKEKAQSEKANAAAKAEEAKVAAWREQQAIAEKEKAQRELERTKLREEALREHLAQQAKTAARDAEYRKRNEAAAQREKERREAAKAQQQAEKEKRAVVDDEDPLFSRAVSTVPNTSTPDDTPAARKQVDALNNTLVSYGLGGTWRNAYAAVKLPDSFSAIQKAFQAAFGRNIRAVVPTDEKFDVFRGVYTPKEPKTIFVNTNENAKEGTEVGFVQIAGHELWHMLERQRPDLLRWYRTVSEKYYKDVPEYQQKLNKLLQKGEKAYSMNKAIAELEADFLGDSLADTTFLQALAEADAGKFKQLLSAITAWLNKVTGKIKGLGSEQYVTDVQALRKHLKEVLVAFAKDGAVPQTNTAQTNTAQTNTAQTNTAQTNTAQTNTDSIVVDGKTRPTENSDGKPIHPTEEGLHNFWRWFGDSQVVDAQGRPKLIYRGEGGVKERNTYSSVDTRENGIFTTPQKDAAAGYERYGQPRAFYVKADRVLDLTQDNSRTRAFVEEWAAHYGDDWVDRQSGERVDAFDVLQGGRMFDYEGDWSAERWKSIQAEALADHDAVYLPDYHDGDGTVSLVVGDTAQMKSATNNNGDFNADDNDVRFSRSDIKYASPEMERLGSIADKYVAKTKTVTERVRAAAGGWLGLETQFVDRLAPLEAVRKTMEPLRGAQMMYFMRFYDQRMNFVQQSVEKGPPMLVQEQHKGSTLYSIEAGGADGASLKGVVTTLKEAAPIVGDGNAVSRLFTMYLSAIRADSKGFSALNFSEDLTAQDLRDIRNTVEANKTLRGVFDRARTEYNNYNRGLIKFLVDAGRLTNETAETLLENNDYVPWYREKAGVVELVIGGENPVQLGNIASQPYLKELVGGDKPILDFAVGAVQNTNMLVEMGLRNIATRNAVSELMLLDLAEPVGAIAGNDIVQYFDGGVEKRARIDTGSKGVPGELLVAGMQGIPTQLTGLLKMFSVASRVLRKGVVLSPHYVAKQLINDSMTAAIASGADFVPVLGALKQIGSPTIRKLEKRGVIGGAVFNGDMHDIPMVLRSIAGNNKTWMQVLAKAEALSMSTDGLTRAAQYDSYIKQGVSEMEATLQALESMNFHKHGASPSAHLANAMIPFFSSQINGLNVLYKSMTGKMSGNEKFKIKRKLYQRGALLTIASFVYAAAMQDDPAYEDARPEEKYTNWFVRVPGVPEPVRIPVPFELGYIFKSLPEAIFNTLHNDTGGTEAAEAFKKIILKTVPGGGSFLIPQLLKPAVEVGFGNDILSAREKQLLPAEQFRDKTSEMAKWLGETFDASPIIIEHLVRGYTGALGMATLHALSLGVPKGDTPEAATKRLADMPIIGGVFQPNDAGGIIDATYKRLEHSVKVKNTVKSLLDSGRTTDAMRYLDNNTKEYAEGELGEYFKQQLGELTKAERAVKASSMSPDEKRAQLTQIKTLKTTVAQTIRRLADETEPL